MKKYIYGIIDSCTHQLGDICLLDRDEEFKDGCLKLFTSSEVPNYLVLDLQAYNFGSVSFAEDNCFFPKFDITPVPKLVLSGASTEVQTIRKGVDSDEDIEADS